ncbi:MAG: M99 family carboxypeptidase catalytic domain-containing protein [Syntrophomonadaceae bacterium]|jgi:predicted deacylase
MKKVRFAGNCVLDAIIIMALVFATILGAPLKSEAASTSYAGQQTQHKIVLAAGTDYATDLYVIQSGQPGPVVMVVGGMHGDGAAGVKAAWEISKLNIDKGTLLVLPEANKRAVQLNQRTVAGEADLNRVFPKTSNEQPTSILVQEIYGVVRDFQVDWLMDLHEGSGYSKVKKGNTGQSLIYYPPQKDAVKVFEKMVNKLNQSISNPDEQFSMLKYPVQGSLARSAAEFLGVNSLIFETCNKQDLETRINHHVKAVEILLDEIGVKDLPATETREKVVLAPGTKWATDLYIIDSGIPGPVVMIVGGVHGSEIAGIRAATKMKDISIERGTLLVLPEANKRAVEVKKRTGPGGSDLNRNFPKTSNSNPSTTLSRAIYDVVKKYKVDWLMDMHEGFDYYLNPATDSVGQTLIRYPSTEMYSMGTKIVKELNKDISKSSHKYTLLKYPVKGSLARSAGEFLGVNSFIFETSMKQTLATRINQQLKAANTLLKELKMVI